VLRTNVADWTPEELWRTYIQLTDAEAAFRIHKSDLSIRPIWHQHAERVQGPAGPLQTAAEPGQPVLNAPTEARMHRPFFLAALDRADEHEGLGPVRSGALLGLHPVPHRVPVLRKLSSRMRQSASEICESPS